MINILESILEYAVSINLGEDDETRQNWVVIDVNKVIHWVDLLPRSL